MDALALISLIMCIISIIVGMAFPVKTAWFIIFTTPILSSGRLVLVPSHVFPLEYIVFSFFLTVGIAISSKFRSVFKIKWFLKFLWIKIVLVFIIVLLFVTFPDELLIVIFMDFSNLFIALIVTFILIKSKKDLLKIITVFVWQSAFIGAFIFIEYINVFDIAAFFRQTLPDYNMDLLENSTRSGFTRIHGLDGGAVHTAARLSVLFPLTLAHSFISKKIIKIIPLALTTLGLVLLMTRAAFVSIFISTFVLLLLMRFHNISSGKILRPFIFLFFSFLILIVVFPFFNEFSTTYFQNYLFPSLFEYSGSVQVKIDRIPRAIKFILDRPFTGYGSRGYVQLILMDTDDVPSPFIYLLSGGFGLFFLFLMTYTYPLYWINSKVFKIYEKDMKIIFLFLFSAFLSGFIIMFSNYLEGHRFIMYILFASLLKYYSIYKWRKAK